MKNMFLISQFIRQKLDYNKTISFCFFLSIISDKIDHLLLNRKTFFFLSPKAAAPKQWKAFDGKITEMDAPYTIRAQELRDIYSTLSMKYLTQDERLDVLLTLKHTVKEHDCKLTQEIIELIDREADLLMRGVKESNLEGKEKCSQLLNIIELIFM